MAHHVDHRSCTHTHSHSPFTLNLNHFLILTSHSLVISLKSVLMHPIHPTHLLNFFAHSPPFLSQSLNQSLTHSLTRLIGALKDSPTTPRLSLSSRRLSVEMPSP